MMIVHHGGKKPPLPHNMTYLSSILTHSSSVNSIDDMLDELEPQEASDVWDQELLDRIDEIVDRKRSSEEGRERALMVYNHYLMIKYCYEEIESKVAELYPALCKSIRADTGEKEACLALRGMRYHHHIIYRYPFLISSQLLALQLLLALPTMSTKIYSDLSNKPTKDQSMLLSKQQLYEQSLR